MTHEASENFLLVSTTAQFEKINKISDFWRLVIMIMKIGNRMKCNCVAISCCPATQTQNLLLVSCEGTPGSGKEALAS